jgi:multiple sugar transport system permease protein
MQVSAWETYYPTLARWLLVGGGMAILMVGLNRILQALGVRREVARGYALTLPWILGFLIWSLYPFLSSLYLSFTKYTILQPPEWIGLDNYKNMFTANKGWKELGPALRLTLLYALFNVPLGTAGSLIVALLLNRGLRGIGVWRTIYYLPAVLPVAAVALLWRWILSPTSGLINSLLKPVYQVLNVDPLPWYTSRDWKMALAAFVVMGMWGVFGANSVILLAGLRNISKELYEAAEIDGAGNWRRFWSVTIPQLSPTTFYIIITGIIGALQIFTQAFFIPIQRPAGTFFNVLIYREAFQFRHMGYACALAWLQLVIILLITMLVIRSSSTWVYYEAEVR